MDELLTYIVTNLVSHPDDVEVREETDGSQVNLYLTVNPEDMGLVIGKGGQTIKSIRKLLITKAIVDNVRVNLQLSEPEGYVKPEKKESDSTSQAPRSDNETETPTTDSPTPADSAETPDTDPADSADTPEE